MTTPGPYCRHQTSSRPRLARGSMAVNSATSAPRSPRNSDPARKPGVQHPPPAAGRGKGSGVSSRQEVARADEMIR
jgi:hypothetical protein